MILTMNPLARAARLHAEADQVMELIHFPAILAAHGPVTFIGSYFLGVMAYPDIDLLIPPVTVEQLFAMGAAFARSPLVTQVVYEPSQDPVNLPDGLYLKPRVAHGDWGRPWKIDIWSLPVAVIEKRRAEMERIRARLTPALRERIIQYKLSIITPEGRTPMYSGHFMYRAFIDEGLTDFEEVTRYLQHNGVKMEK